MTDHHRAPTTGTRANHGGLPLLGARAGLEATPDRPEAHTRPLRPATPTRLRSPRFPLRRHGLRQTRDTCLRPAAPHGQDDPTPEGT